MKVTTTVKAGALTFNHNTTLVRKASQGFKVKTQIKTGLKDVLVTS